MEIRQELDRKDKAAVEGSPTRSLEVDDEKTIHVPKRLMRYDDDERPRISENDMEKMLEEGGGDDDDDDDFI